MKRMVVAGGLAGVVLAGAVLAAEQQVTASMHTFTDSEDNRVETWAVELLQGLRERWNLSLRGALDRVLLPPLPGLPGSPENVDAITTASRPVASTTLSKEEYAKLRQEMVAGLKWSQPHGSRIGGSLYYSHEPDFIGRQVSGSLAHDFHQGNTNLAFGVAHGFDSIRPEPEEGVAGPQHQRQTEDLTCVWTQTVSPRTLTQLGFETTWVHGFQSNPYRQVYAGGQRLPERHPDRRLRQALFAQIDRYLFTRSSVSLRARYYDDDWGVHAGTFDAHLNQYVGEHLIVRYRYRYHLQTAAYFYRDLYTDPEGVDGYRTADYKLDDFDSHLFGVKLSVPFEGLAVRPWMSGLVLDLKYERYFDSKSFAANVLETGFTWPF